MILTWRRCETKELSSVSKLLPIEKFRKIKTTIKKRSMMKGTQILTKTS